MDRNTVAYLVEENPRPSDASKDSGGGATRKANLAALDGVRPSPASLTHDSILSPVRKLLFVAPAVLPLSRFRVLAVVE
jgi:hypothetical protein